MRSKLLSSLVVGALALAAIPTMTVSASASGGCGPFAHRGFYGYCRPNGYGYYGYRPLGFYGGYRPYGWGGGWHRGWGWRRHW